MRITITGPRSVGKTTISKIVAEKLGLKYISSDEIGEKSFEKHGGLDRAMKSGIVEDSIKKGGYSFILEVYDKKDNFLFDLSGGSFASKKLPEQTLEVRTKAKNRSIVIGLLPYEDKEKSIRLLFDRERKRLHFREMNDKDLLEKTRRSYDNFDTFNEYCNLIVYTEDKSPQDVAMEVIDFIKKTKV